jgi:hypothetical protein
VRHAGEHGLASLFCALQGLAQPLKGFVHSAHFSRPGDRLVSGRLACCESIRHGGEMTQWAGDLPRKQHATNKNHGCDCTRQCENACAETVGR